MAASLLNTKTVRSQKSLMRASHAFFIWTRCLALARQPSILWSGVWKWCLGIMKQSTRHHQHFLRLDSMPSNLISPAHGIVAELKLQSNRTGMTAAYSSSSSLHASFTAPSRWSATRNPQFWTSMNAKISSLDVFCTQKTASHLRGRVITGWKTILQALISKHY